MTASTQQHVSVVVDRKATVKQEIVQQPGNKITTWCAENWRAVLAEFIATAILLLIGCMGSCKLPNEVLTPPLYGAFGFGFTVLMNIVIFGHISGAHMNPIVSIGAAIWGSLSIPLTVLYIIAQIGGAIVGYGLLFLLTADPLAPEAMCVTAPRDEMTAGQTLGIEIVLSATLNFVNCAVWDPRNSAMKEGVPIKFGFVISALSIAGGPLTGASMNPARTLAPAIWNDSWVQHWTYWVGPVVGGIFSVLIYKLVWKPSEKENSPEEILLEKF